MLHMYLAGQLSRYVQSPTKQNIGVAKRHGTQTKQLAKSSKASVSQIRGTIKSLLATGVAWQEVPLHSSLPYCSRRHYVRDQVAKKIVNLWKVKTNTSPSGMIDEGTR
ncbi:hypothetical protein F443_22867 [Phytophthora nicotianae P1569]|uniref:Uncharacterized protein n=1 Tax=Phytophthora nicotianae P1569 TaxID=1317065 RepID=V9DT24_PHYNI|nr:hypothetical protein F443_22867 [Phytophthora nicotianae P1569]